MDDAIGPARRAGPRVYAQLVLASVLFGGTLPFVQHALGFIGPYTFLALRFTIGSVLLLAVYGSRVVRMPPKQLLAGVLIGVFAFAAWLLQTLGLQHSTVSKVGFITALYVPFVTLLSVLVWRRPPSRRAVAGVALSTVGLMLLSLGLDLDLRFGVGEWLVLACAVATASHIVAIGRFAPDADAGALATVQVVAAAVLSVGVIPFSGETLPGDVPVSAWLAVVVMGVFATALCFALMNHAQRFVSDVHATLVYALEPVWSAVAGFLIGDRLTPVNWVGAAVILAGLLLGDSEREDDRAALEAGARTARGGHGTGRGRS